MRKDRKTIILRVIRFQRRSSKCRVRRQIDPAHFAAGRGGAGLYAPPPPPSSFMCGGDSFCLFDDLLFVFQGQHLGAGVGEIDDKIVVPSTTLGNSNPCIPLASSSRARSIEATKSCSRTRRAESSIAVMGFPRRRSSPNRKSPSPNAPVEKPIFHSEHPVLDCQLVPNTHDNVLYRQKQWFCQSRGIGFRIP